MPARRVCSLSLAGLMVISACGDGSPESPADAGSDAGPAQEMLLNRVGIGMLTLHPNDVVKLRTLLIRTNAQVLEDGMLSPAPVPDAHVTFSFVYQPGTAAISTLTATTNAHGYCESVLKVGANISDTVELRADSPGATSHAVWRISSERPDGGG